MFSLAGIISFKMLPKDRSTRFFDKNGQGASAACWLGRWKWRCCLHCLNRSSSGQAITPSSGFTNGGGVLPVFITTYIPFFQAANYVPDMNPKNRKAFLIGVWALDALQITLITLGMI